MRTKSVIGTVVIVVGIVSLMVSGKRNVVQDRSQETVVGIWRAQFNNAPVLDIDLRIKDRKLIGTATIYLLEDTSTGSSIKNKNEAPLEDISLAKNELKFSIKREDGTIFKAIMEFTDDNVALLKPGDQKEAANNLKMIRSHQVSQNRYQLT